MTSSHVEMSNPGPEDDDEPPISSLKHRKSASPSNKEVSRSSSTSPHPLQFITLTERPSSQKNDYSYTVRSHAMQAFLREKKNAKGDHLNPESARVKEHDQQTPKQLSGKFKLATWSRKPRSRRTKSPTSRENSAESVSVKEEDIHSEDSSTPIETYETTVSSPLVEVNILDLLYHCITPISLCPICQTLFEDGTPFTKQGPAWEPSNATDPALVQATLCLVTQNQDLLSGSHESPETLFHKGEAMMLMNRRLMERSHVISDADITAVAIFVMLETFNGTFEAANTHRTGLLKMINVQGSITRFEENDTVLRVLAWSDIMFSTRFGLPPQFSHVPENISISFEIPPTSEDSYSDVFDDPATTSILHSLRYISSNIDTPNLSSSDKKDLTDIIYHTQYTLLTSPYLSSFQYQSPTSSPQTKPIPQTQPPHQLLETAFHISSLLYIHSNIYTRPSLTLLHTRLLAHVLDIVSTLSSFSTNNQTTFQIQHQHQHQHQHQTPHLTPQDLSLIDPSLRPQHSSQLSAPTTFNNPETNIFLWILCVALTSTSELPIKTSFTRILKNALTTHKETQDIDLRKRLRDVVWRDRDSEILEGILTEVLGENSNR